MAENTPNPPSESGKVQPKKETVRINLPPKPTASPTVRLPSPGSGGVAAPKTATSAPAGGGAAKPSGTPSGGASAPKPASQAPPAAPSPTIGGSPAPRPAAPPRRAAAGPSVSGLDVGLSIAAAVIGAATLIHVLLLSL